ncbi:MAG: amidohydrolase family protein [Clostridia bacterium]
MKIIDAHMHFSKLQAFMHAAETVSLLDYSLEGFQREYRGASVVAAVGMGLGEKTPGAFPDGEIQNPMGLDLDALPGEMAVCLGINPVRLEKERKKELDRIEEGMANPRTVGIKIYAGYYPYYAHDGIYEPLYRLAGEYRLSVVVHAGSTYSEKGLLKYAHPLSVDEAAIKFRDVTFILAHMGDPWIMDTAAMIWKAPNVYADLSGLIVSHRKKTEELKDNPQVTAYLSQMLAFIDRYDRLLFGSDWPLVPLEPYIEFIRGIIPEKHHGDVFRGNALVAFKKLEGFMHAAGLGV